MSATRLTILEKTAPVELFPSVPQNFRVGEGESVPPEMVVRNPNVSLYCLDDENRRALFVELPPSVDLSEAPFFYQTQYEQAQRLIAVSYDSLHALAEALPDPDRRLILVYSVGRCGSTLISKALNEVAGVVSYSEPDVYTQIAMLRFADSQLDEHYIRLLKSCTRLLCRGTETFALKFRSNVTQIGDLLYRAFPEAKNLFLYRHAETWAQSMASAFSSAAGTAPQNPIFLQFLGSTSPLTMPFIEQQGRAPDMIESFSLMWLSTITKALALHDQGIPFLSLRYEEIRSQPRQVLAAIFAYCGLDAAQVDSAYEAFAKDSQEGTSISQEQRQQNASTVLGEQDYARMRALFAQHPVVQSPDFVVPGTWRP